MKSRLLPVAVLLAAIVAVGGWYVATRQKENGLAGPRQLNLLCWSGYDDPPFIGAFEKKYNVKVNTKTFFGGDGMLALLSQSPNTYDVIVVDKDYLNKLYRAGRLDTLPASDFDFSNYFDTFKSQPYSTIDGKLYGVMVEWGTSALAYNTEKLTAEQVRSYKILWDPAVKGRVGVWDWYLPNMGIVSLSLGNAKPFDLNANQYEVLKDRLFKMRPQVAAFHASSSEIVAGLARGDTWIVPGAGEWLASIVAQQGKPIDWVIPDEGALLWVDLLVTPTDSPHKDTAREYIKWMTSPDAQAMLSQKSAFHANVPNRRAYDLLSPAQRRILKVDASTDVDAILSRLHDRTLPPGQEEKHWQQTWEEFKGR